MVTQNTDSGPQRSLGCYPLLQSPLALQSTARIRAKEMTMAKLKSLDDLLVHELQDIYHAEGQITKALPRMIKAASSPELQAAFEEHLEQTEGQIERLEQVF